MSRTARLRIVGARRGHGATTVALAVASHAADSGRQVAVVVDDLDDACAVCGVSTPPTPQRVPVATGLTLVPMNSEPGDEADLIVEDIGHVENALPAVTLLVVRGPDYLSLRTALRHPVGAHGVVVVREPWRALGPADVASVLGIPVIAEIPHSDDVARATDAGLLVCRAASMSPFQRVHRLVTDGVHPAFAPAPAA